MKHPFPPSPATHFLLRSTYIACPFVSAQSSAVPHSYAVQTSALALQTHIPLRPVAVYYNRIQS